MGRSSAAEKVEVGDFTKKNGDKLGYIGYIGISGIVYICIYIIIYIYNINLSIYGSILWNRG